MTGIEHVATIWPPVDHQIILLHPDIHVILITFSIVFNTPPKQHLDFSSAVISPFIKNVVLCFFFIYLFFFMTFLMLALLATVFLQSTQSLCSLLGCCFLGDAVDEVAALSPVQSHLLHCPSQELLFLFIPNKPGE